MGWHLETMRSSSLAIHPQLFENGIPAIDGLDAPRQRQNITPVTVGMKQRLEPCIVTFAQRALELRKPALGDRQIGFSSGKHGVRFGFYQAISPSPAEKVTLPSLYVRFWHTDIAVVEIDFCFRGQSGHHAGVPQCPLMTQSGHGLKVYQPARHTFLVIC